MKKRELRPSKSLRTAYFIVCICLRIISTSGTDCTTVSIHGRAKIWILGNKFCPFFVETKFRNLFAFDWCLVLITVDFYHSDTMLKQNQLAQDISDLVITPSKKKELVDTVDTTLEWIQAGFCIIKNHWHTIDYHRMNKFLLLSRMVILQGLKYIQEKGFKKSTFTEYNQILNSTLLDESALGKDDRTDLIDG